MYINEIFLINNCEYNPGCQECRNHPSIRGTLFPCWFILWIYYVNLQQESTFFHTALTLYVPCSCVPVVFFAQVQAVLLRGVLGGPRVCIHWLLLHLNQTELAGRSRLPVPWGSSQRRRGEKRQQSYCWSALLSYDKIQSDFCPGPKRILRVIIIVKLCQAVKPFKWWLRGGRYEGKRLLFLQHLSQLICQAAS